MLKKLGTIAFLLALLVSLVPGSPATAAVESVGNRYGKVIAISGNTITINNFDDVEKTILVDSTTKFFKVTGARLTLAKVKVGSWIFASGNNDVGSSLTATTIILVTKKYARAAYWNYRREFGTVISVNAPYGVFFVKSDKSGTIKAIAYGGTRFLNPKVNRVSKIKVGMKVALASQTQSNGYILTTAVIAFKPARR